MDNSSTESTVSFVPVVIVVIAFIVSIAGGVGFYVVKNVQETSARDLRSSARFSVNKDRVIVDSGQTGNSGGSPENLPSNTPMPIKEPEALILKDSPTGAPLYPTLGVTIAAGAPAESVVLNKTVSSWKIGFPKRSYKIDDNLVAVDYDNSRFPSPTPGGMLLGLTPVFFLPYIEGTLTAPVPKNSVVCIDFEETFYTAYDGSTKLAKLCDSVNKPLDPFTVHCAKYSTDGIPVGEVVYQRGYNHCDQHSDADPGEYILKAKIGYNCAASAVGNPTTEAFATCKSTKEVFSEPVTLTK